jgi:hypothetical protein
MLKIETKELIISEKLRKKVDMICKFANVKPKYQNGSVINIVNSNIAYAKPHIITINNNDYLIFEESDDIYINGYSKRIKFKDLEQYIKSN